MTDQPLEGRNSIWRLKVIAILIAILFGPCTWFYTLKKDSWKLIILLGILLGGVSVFVMVWDSTDAMQANTHLPPGDPNDGIAYARIGLFIGTAICFAILIIGFWLWAIIDSATKSQAWYKVLPGNSEKKSWIALCLAFFCGPWTWLYTYNRDWRKLITGIVIGWGIPSVFWLVIKLPLTIPLGNPVFGYPAVSFIMLSLGVWLWAVILAWKRPQSWY
jgi:multisubunit Na+/H+ antiporter MnhC subunit